MNTEPELLNERLERLAMVLDEIMPQCALLVRDALELLKEQEAVEPYSINAERTYGLCPKCGKLIFRYGNVEENHYCGVCGQTVKWE